MLIWPAAPKRLLAPTLQHGINLMLVFLFLGVFLYAVICKIRKMASPQIEMVLNVADTKVLQLC